MTHIEPLTAREEEVVIAVGRGDNDSEIELGARNRVELAMWAYETGRVDV